MITNGRCTIVRCENDAYYLIWQGDCMWQEVKGAETKAYGEERADSVSVWICDMSAEISEGDMIIRGDYDDYELAAKNGLTVSSVSCNDYGSPEMHHIEMGAK